MKIQNLKKLFLCTLIASSVNLAFSYETGGLISNDSDFSNRKKDGDLKLLQKNAANLWLRAPISADGESYFTTEGEFRTEYDFNEADKDEKLTMAADLSLCKIVLKKEFDASDIQFSLGRFYNSDLSGIAYAQNGDGLKFELNKARFHLSAFGAYTGLLNAKNVTIIELGEAPDLSDKKKLYVTANKYLVEGVTFTLPNLIASQTVALEFFNTSSLEDTEYNRMYGSFALSGPLFSPLFYDISTTFSYAKYDDGDWEKGNLSKASISAYPEFKSMSISLNGVYASGGTKGSLKAFQGFTSGSIDRSQSEPEYSGVAKLGISGTIKPLPNLLLNIGADTVYDTAAGDEKDEIKNRGFQYIAGFNWQVVSDVQLGASLSQFIASSDYEDESKTQLKITANIAF